MENYKAEGKKRRVLVRKGAVEKRRSRRGRRLKGRHKGIAYDDCLDKNKLPMSLNDSL